MKKILLFVVLLMQINLLFSQISVLDEKNGFKSLKFGTHKDNYNIPTSEKTDDYELILYNTSNSDLTHVFNSEMDELFLSFEKNLLTGIILKKKYRSQNDLEEGMRELENLREKFTQVLGAHNSTTDSDLGAGPVWIAENVTLYVLYQLEEMKIDKNGDPLVVSNIKVIFSREDKNNSRALIDGF